MGRKDVTKSLISISPLASRLNAIGVAGSIGGASGGKGGSRDSILGKAKWRPASTGQIL